MRKRIFLPIVLIFFSLVMPMVVLADEPPLNTQGPDVPVPLDGGVSLLVAAGVGYGVKKYRDAKKAASQHDKG